MSRDDSWYILLMIDWLKERNRTYKIKYFRSLLFSKIKLFDYINQIIYVLINYLKSRTTLHISKTYSFCIKKNKRVKIPNWTTDNIKISQFQWVLYFTQLKG